MEPTPTSTQSTTTNLSEALAAHLIGFADPQSANFYYSTCATIGEEYPEDGSYSSPASPEYQYASVYAPTPIYPINYNYESVTDDVAQSPVSDGGDLYVAQDVFTMPFDELENAKIGVEATAYLQNMLEKPPTQEPLLAALGGEPMAMKRHIEAELDTWASHRMTPLFVFEGQSTIGRDEVALASAKAALLKTKEAWELYSDGEPSEAVTSFGNSRAVRGQELYRILQEVLLERGLEFIVAPFSACAQLAYLIQLDTQFIDGIMGSQELLLYNIDDAVINPPSSDDWEKKQFTGVLKSELQKRLHNITDDMLSDALLMSGTSFLPTFPPLLDSAVIRAQPPTLLDAINLLRTHNKSVAATVGSFNDILKAQDPEWQDKFRKAKMAVDHCVTVQVDGSVHIKDYETLTEDNVKYLGYQLPSELYHYLSKALIGPRVLNSFNNSLRSVVFPTLDGETSEEYRTLVTRSLVPVKETTTAIISSPLTRYFGANSMKVKYWFDDKLETSLTPSIQLQPAPSRIADTWLVTDSDLKGPESATQLSAGKLSFAVLSLLQKDFSKKSIRSTSNGPGSKGPFLKSKPELLSNAIWRFLHLRGYVNDQHELTSWGKALAITLKSIGPSVKAHNDAHHLEEAAFLAYELLRYDNLNARNRHPELTGVPLRGSDEDKANCLLVGRTACLLSLRHNSIGYTGPLSKNFLTFYSIVKAVRETDRDLLEAITAAMFMGNQVSRDRTDYGDIGRSLPFSIDINIGLGIAVKTYLDDHMKLDESPAVAKSTYGPKFLPNHVNITEDLNIAFSFFDALHDGIKTLGSEVSDKDKKAWDNAKEYLAKRR